VGKSGSIRRKRSHLSLNGSRPSSFIGRNVKVGAAKRPDPEFIGSSWYRSSRNNMNSEPALYLLIGKKGLSKERPERNEVVLNERVVLNAPC